MPQYVEYGPDQYMDPNGSSLMGYVTATYGELVGLFGEPNCPPGDKTWNSWDISFTVFEAVSYTHLTLPTILLV